MDFLTVEEELQIYYEYQGSGPVVVWLHDGLVHRETWDAQWDAFVDRYTLSNYGIISYFGCGFFTIVF